MSLLGKQWVRPNANSPLAQQISSELNLPLSVAQVLLNRKINSSTEANDFLNPRLNLLENPFDIPDMAKGIKRLLVARDFKEKVLVYGDYDVDGVTGTTILTTIFRDLGIRTEFYVPHRYDEGYGLNEEAVKKAKEQGFSLIVTVDCGVSNVKEVELANQLGLHVVITDHHQPPAKLPPAFAVIDPKLICGYHPSKHLAGVGVAFKFAWGLLRMAGVEGDDKVRDLLDLVGLGTVADVVPLLEENRILTIYGLRSLNEGKRVGIKQLMEVAGIKGNVNTGHINFGISPRINAAGRLEHAHLSVNLLLEKSEEKAREIAEELNRINTRRQGVGNNIFAEAENKILSRAWEKDKMIIESGDNWHPGVIGIAASKLADRYYRPVILIGINEGVARGSARSVAGFNVFELLSSCRDMYIDFGGHEGAAGFEIQPEKIDDLRQRLILESEGRIKFEELAPKVYIDAELDPSEITLARAKELQKLEPFGPGNPQPIFSTSGLRILDARRVGGTGAHLKIKVTDGKALIDGIGFGLGDLADMIKANQIYTVAYNLESNEFNGRETEQLKLVDIE